MTEEQKQHIRNLHQKRSELLSELGKIDNQLRAAANDGAISQVVVICTCGAEFVSTHDFQIHLSLPKNSDHTKFSEETRIVTPTTRPIDFNIDRKFRCLCGIEFLTFLDRMIHIDNSPTSERHKHGDNGEILGGKLITRDVKIKGDPIISKRGVLRAVDSVDDLD